MSVISDIALAVVSAPVSIVMGAWRRRFGRGDVPSDDGQMDHLQSDTGEQLNGHGHASADISREAPDAHSRIPRPTAIRKTDSSSSSRSLPRENGHPIAVPNRDEPGVAQDHEIWYPPLSAYEEDEEEDNRATPKPEETATSSSTDSEITLVSVEEVDEWRLYPQFPSAYPPTPLITLTRLVSSKSTDLDANPRINGSALPKIEEVSNEGFRLSLSPPLDATNPGSFGDLGDEKRDLGIHKAREDDDMTMSDDRDISMADSTSLDEDDEEDEFNITLQTPVPVRVISETRFHASRMTSRTTSLATTMSTRSLSAGLSTVDNGSSLRTRSSLDSISSAAISSGEDSPVIGKKRPLPAPRRVNNRNHKVVVDSGLDPALTYNSTGDERHASIMPSDTQKIHDDGNAATEKRRRVTSPNRIGVRTSKPIRHVRPRLGRAASPPARIQRFERKAGPGQAKSIPQTRTSALRTDRWAHGGADSGVAISKSVPRRTLASQVEETTLRSAP